MGNSNYTVVYLSVRVERFLMAHKLFVPCCCRKCMGKTVAIMASAVILAVSSMLSSSSTALAFGQRTLRLSWAMVAYGKESGKSDQRSRRDDLPGKIEGASSSGERE